MATKNYVNIDDLSLFKDLLESNIGTEISTAEAKSLHVVELSGTTLKFYKDEHPTSSSVPDYSISLPQQDLSHLMPKLISATGGKIAVSTNAGIVIESDTELSDLATTSYVDDAVDDLADTLADVATSGAAEDVLVVDAGGYFTSTNVEGVLAELAQASSGGVSAKTVYVTETAGGSSDPYSKRYGVYQGANGTSSSPVPAEKLVDIDIPKDMVVESGSVVDIVFKASDNTLHEGSESGADVTVTIKGQGVTPTADDAGKYIKLVIANHTSSALYIKATDLVDTYTAQQNATQIQLAIDSNNVISATVVAGSIGATELASNAVTTAKIADDAVTAAKIDISAHTESQTASTDGLALSVTTTDGQVSAISGSIAANTYDAYGAASTVQSTVIGASGDASTANTIYGAKAYADAATDRVGETAIRALFS